MLTRRGLLRGLMAAVAVKVLPSPKPTKLLTDGSTIYESWDIAMKHDNVVRWVPVIGYSSTPGTLHVESLEATMEVVVFKDHLKGWHIVKPT